MVSQGEENANECEISEYLVINQNLTTAVAVVFASLTSVRSLTAQNWLFVFRWFFPQPMSQLEENSYQTLDMVWQNVNV